ncbi:hypothetical protein L1887_36996 [Cichorium endivia]|nr:hypothetical protein L1887_36996 [Cichorium endivia]
MSDQIPFHIQEEIMKRLPVKSLVQFRSVSKAWKSLIESSDFIAAQNLHRHNQPQHLIVSFEFPAFEEDCVIFSRCYIDDDNFPLQISLPTLPLSVNQLTLSTIVGSSHGLVCLYGSHPDFSSKMAVVCNPSIRKSFVVAVPGLPFVLHEPSVGFGVCPVTRDPKIVAIIHSSEVMVYTLKSGEWRSVFGNLPTIGTRDLFCSVVTDRFIYWRAESQTRKMVMSFDVTSENFEAIDLPDISPYLEGSCRRVNCCLDLTETAVGTSFRCEKIIRR